MAVLCLAAAGNLVFSGSADKNICVWRSEGNGAHSCLAVLTGHTGPVKCLAVSQDHESDNQKDGDQRWIVYSGSLDKSVKVWRVSDQAPDMRLGRWSPNAKLDIGRGAQLNEQNLKLLLPPFYTYCVYMHCKEWIENVVHIVVVEELYQS
ncbi:hypothetical protein JRO89_XS02G0054700 [Xanthoceras sorbifolium]|uniref:Uncharacterized protein n=1 Tax=Xanthoceras sorbifolium TaxID=99658 RepID=A0ABQ8IES6_9ROSI|nr:hypothetical protein JRO89_XS02G0054700 [Xanthoceras sorbifolium]